MSFQAISCVAADEISLQIPLEDGHAERMGDGLLIVIQEGNRVVLSTADLGLMLALA